MRTRAAYFVNSRVEFLGSFLAEYAGHHRRLDEGAARADSVRLCRGRMQEFDPAALDDQTGFWPVVLEEIESGLS